MKKLLAILAISAMVAGCCTITSETGVTTKNPINCIKLMGKAVCSNRVAIDNALNNVIVASNAFISILPVASPYILVAQQAIMMAQTSLAKACPTPEDVAAAQAKYTEAVVSAQKAGLRIGR